MKKRILIVDDDQGFGDLLKGVFEQAGYAVDYCLDAESGLERIRNESFDLLITDQRLPGESNGIELIRQFRDLGISLPAIMISGYLDNDSIRHLIREGVEGVFIKPLNIFSLLKKASEVLEARAHQPAGAAAEPAAGEAASGGDAAIGHILGLSEKGQRFLERAREAATFRRNLLLIGPPGTLFEQIGRDLVAASPVPARCISFNPGEITPEAVERLVSGDQAGEPLVLIILQTEELETEEVARLIDLMDRNGGSGGSIRMIFALQESVEDLYDAGRIDEEFYLFLGTNELRVPALRDMPEDLLEITRREIAEQTHKGPSIDAKLRSLLLEYEWPDNLLELRSVIVRAISLSHPMPPVLKHFQAVLNRAGPEEDSEAGFRSSLERFLTEERKRYRSALAILREH